jgi:hypothetical protein
VLLKFFRLFSVFREAEADARLATANAERCKREALNDREARRSLEADHKAVCAQLQDVTTQNLILQDRMEALLSDRNRLWDLVARSIEDMKISYQMHVNEQWQKQYGTAPYPDAPQIPEHSTARPVNNPIVPGTMLPGERVRQQTAVFLKSYQGR